MILLDTVLDLSLYKTAYIIKTMINIIAITTPLIIIIKSIIDIVTSINSTDKIIKTPIIFLRRIILGLIIFMIPTLLTSLITLFTNNNIKDNTIFTYYKDASSNKIKEIQEKLDNEETERKNLEKAKEKENFIVSGKYERIKNEQSEETKEEPNNNDSNNNNETKDNNTNNKPPQGEEVLVNSKTGDGTYGRVRVENGVFYIPNKRATSNADTPTLSGDHGLNPVFWDRLNKFIKDASKNGYKITITSAIRPYSKQLQLWNNSSRSCSERSKWVACPGGSRHGWGIAADLKYNGKSCSQSNWDCNAAARWAHNNASKYLLKYRMKWEPWHIEPAQVKGGSYGKCTAKC